MDYIILNNDGSLQKQSLTRYINQGSHGVDKIFIGWANGLATDILQVVFTLPNQTTNTVLGEFESNYNYDGEHTVNGWVITLTNAQTTYNGLLLASARIIRSGIVQVAYPFTLVINETGVMPDTDSGLTIAQIDSYLLNIQNLVTNAVRQNTDAALSSTSENPVQNKVVKQAIDDAVAGVYKIQGSTYVATLNGLTVTEEMNGYVYNMIDGGTLTNSTDTTTVQAGDNVVLVWNEGTWYWDRLSGVVDTSNLVTLNSAQTITGIKTFEGDLKFKGVGVSTVGQITTTSYSVKIGYGGVNHISIDGDKIYPLVANYDLGSSSKQWKNLYLGGKVDFGTKVADRTNTVYMDLDSYDGLRFYINNTNVLTIYDNGIYAKTDVIPNTTNTYSLGNSTRYFNDLYLSGKYYLASDKYIYLDSSNRIVFSNNSDRLKIDSTGNVWFVANAIPLITNNYDLGGSSNTWKNLYLGGVAYIGSGSQITQSPDGSLQVTLSGDGKSFKPSWNNHYNLGLSSYKWNYIYVNYVSDGTNNVTVADIGKKLYKHTIISNYQDWDYMRLVIVSTDSNACSLSQDVYQLLTSGIGNLVSAYLVDETIDLLASVSSYNVNSVTSLSVSCISSVGGTPSVVNGTLDDNDDIEDTVIAIN